MTDHVPEDLVVDLLRSAWVVEQARSLVYERWSPADARFGASAERAAEAAAIITRSLDARGRAPDEILIEAHAAWIESLAGRVPGEVPLGDLLIVRLGDWVEAHASRFLDSGANRLRELSEAERAAARFPSSLPDPPPFEPLAVPEVEPPGNARFRFAVLGDLHFGSEHAETMAREAVADINSSGAELVIQLGDITDRGERDQFELATRVLEGLEAPCVTMLGNHDVFSYTEDRLAGRDYYPQSFGREPDGVVIEHQGFRFAVLDSAEDDTSPFAPFDLVTGTFTEGTGGAVVRGSLTAPQHDILADVAAPDSAPAFVFLHHPPQPFWGFPPVLFGLRDVDTGRLHAVCDSGNVWGVFAGHTHRNARTRHFDGVPAVEVATPRDFPFGFAIVDVADEGYAFRFLQISDEELLRAAYRRAGEIIRRYGRGRPEDRAFVWRRSDASPSRPPVSYAW